MIALPPSWSVFRKFTLTKANLFDEPRREVQESNSGLFFSADVEHHLIRVHCSTNPRSKWYGLPHRFYIRASHGTRGRYPWKDPHFWDNMFFYMYVDFAKHFRRTNHTILRNLGVSNSKVNIARMQMMRENYRTWITDLRIYSRARYEEVFNLKVDWKEDYYA